MMTVMKQSSTILLTKTKETRVVKNGEGKQSGQISCPVIHTVLTRFVCGIHGYC